MNASKIRTLIVARGFFTLVVVGLLAAPARGQTTLYTFNGDSADDQFGRSVSGAGDVNGDGFPDLIVGAPHNNPVGDNSGSARVLSGLDGSILYTFDGDSDGDNFGYSVSGAGDVNGDGFADLIVGAYGDDNNGIGSGRARVFSGLDGSILYTFDGDSAGDQFGWSVSGAGDVNADGFADLIVGALHDDNNGTDSGSTRVFAGSDDSDGDGLLNSTEVELRIANGSDCPDPLNPDSDGDTLSDGEEVALGTDPCNADTDGDTLTDDVDSHPLDPEVSSGDLEDAMRLLSDVILGLDLSFLNGANDNANAGRRNALANRVTNAANAIAINDIQGAIDELTSLLAKIDGVSPPPDWMDDSSEKTALQVDVTVLIALLLLEL